MYVKKRSVSSLFFIGAITTITSFLASACNFTKEDSVGFSNNSSSQTGATTLTSIVPTPNPTPTNTPVIDLDPPSGLQATTVSSSQINLSWADNSADDIGFRIERSTTSNFSNPVIVATTAANVMSYSINNLLADTNYFFRVIAIGNGAESVPSIIVSSKTNIVAVTIPAVPTSLVATATSNTQINLTWVDSSNNETGFDIDRATNSTFSTGLVTTAITVANTVTYSATGLSSSTKYYFRIRSKNSAGSSTNSAVANATTQAPPAVIAIAPTGITAVAVSQGQVNLTWIDNSNNESGFKVQYATNSAFTSATTLPTTAQNITSLSVTGLAASTTYYFRVSATNSAGDSSYTSSASATTMAAPSAPLAPSVLAGIAVSTSNINLTWIDNSNNESGFVVERASTSAFTNAVLLNLSANAVSASVTGLSASTTYYFRVKATNTVGSSAYSNTVSVTTQTAVAGTPVNPLIYYNFETTSAGVYTTNPKPNVCATAPSISTTHCLNFNNYSATLDIKSGGPTGNYLVYKPSYSLMIGNNGADLSSTAGSFTIEFLIKPDPSSSNSTLFHAGFSTDSFNIRNEFPNLQIDTSSKNSAGQTVDDRQTIELMGIGLGSYGYLFDGNWHHIVFRFQGSSSGNAVKSFCIDGQCPAAWQKTIPQSNFILGKNIPGLGNTSAQYVTPNVSMDQIAIYNTAISNSLVLQHYNNFTSGQPYDFSDRGISVPTPAPISNEVYDMAEFAPNSQVPTQVASRTDGISGLYAIVPNNVPDALTQLKSYPAPRYRAGHTMPFHFNWMDTMYMTGVLQPGGPTIYTAGPIVTNLMKELGNPFHYGITLSADRGRTSYTPSTNEWNYYGIQAANDPANANVPLNYVVFGHVGFTEQNHASACYLQNASGQFVNEDGNVTTNKKIRRSFSGTNSYCPDSVWDAAGLGLKTDIVNQLNYINKNVNIINENGEMISASSANLVSGSSSQVDPIIKAEYLSSGLSSWKTYEGKWLNRIETRFGANILSGSAQTSKMANAKFTLYARDGYGFYYDWSDIRTTQSLINGNRYATADFYLQSPKWWHYSSVAADHGLAWFEYGVRNQLLAGDKYFSPFVSPGWNVREEKQIRPGQWMGLLKSLAALGAEWFYAGMFNNVAVGGGNSDLQEPRNWIWQAAIPSYVQAAVSREEDLYRNSSIMLGDVPYSSANSTAFALPSYRFGATDPNKVIRVRKHNTLNKYMIFSTVQRHNNFDMPNKTVPVEITLDGQKIQFMTRVQGSIFVYDKTVNPPVFKQIDSEHEYKHPSHWTKDFYIQGELPDNISSSFVVRTSGAVGNDFKNISNALGFSATSTSPIYKFTPRLDLSNPTQTSRTYYTFIKARKSGSAGNLSMYLNGSATALKAINISNDNFGWCRVESASQAPLININFGNPAVFNQQELKLTPSSTSLEIDEILITTNGNLNPAPYLGNCANGI